MGITNTQKTMVIYLNAKYCKHFLLYHRTILILHLYIMWICYHHFSGQWNVPYITDIYLIKNTKIPLLKGGYTDGKLDPDMALCKRMRDKVITCIII